MANDTDDTWDNQDTQDSDATESATQDSKSRTQEIDEAERERRYLEWIDHMSPGMAVYYANARPGYTDVEMLDDEDGSWQAARHAEAVARYGSEEAWERAVIEATLRFRKLWRERRGIPLTLLPLGPLADPDSDQQ